ncbi:MAG: proteasome-type protease [Pseudomonadota bacterium]
MTYCVGFLLDAGLVFLADSRTSAGVDQVSTFRKVTVFQKRKDRVIVLMSSGNLAISQSVVSLMHEHRESGAEVNINSVPNMFEAARYVGDVLREVHRRDAEALKEHGVEFNATFILGGQIGTEPPRLFSLYPAGNFIEATSDTPYLQIGESKYGKPIIDRVISRSTSLAQAAKCALISMDSTIKSNISVGLPLDLICVKRDALQVLSHVNIDTEHEYFKLIRSRWGESLRHAFHAMPDPEWLRQS